MNQDMRASKKKLSIIVPVYNMASNNKLRFCLDSLVNQTISNYEIIAVDDCSTDDSLRILREYEKRYSELIRVVESDENGRQGAAKNKALDICEGEYIGFVDSDDWVHESMYEKLVFEAEKNKADIVACDITMTREHSFDVYEIYSGISPESIGKIDDEKFRNLINNSGYMVVKIYARHIFFSPELRFPEKMFYEDNAIGLEVIHRAKYISHIEKPMYYYYQHSESTVHSVSEERCYDRMNAMNIMLDYAIRGEYLEPFYKEIEYKYICLFYKNTLFSYMQGKQKKKISFIRELGNEMRKKFPDFQKNEIYLSNTNKEEIKLIRMQQSNTLFFFIYYKLLWTYRKIRYGM